MAGAEQQWNDAMKAIEDKLQVRQSVLYTCISKFTLLISVQHELIAQHGVHSVRVCASITAKQRAMVNICSRQDVEQSGLLPLHGPFFLSC